MSLDYLVLSETKLDESFPNTQCNRDGYQLGIEINLGEVSLSMFEKVRSVKELPRISRVIVNVFVLRLLFEKNWVIVIIYGPPNAEYLASNFFIYMNIVHINKYNYKLQSPGALNIKETPGHKQKKNTKKK